MSTRCSDTAKNMDTCEQLKAIKQSFRLLMNGETSRSMREKGGSQYKLNWGIPQHELRKMAAELPHDYDLAIALWKEDIRECKILATMLMPRERMSKELVDVWMEQTHSLEIAEVAALNLYQHLSFAPAIAYQWLASNNELRQVTAYHILARLFMNGREPNDRGINELLDQALTALQDKSAAVRHAANNCLVRFGELGNEYQALLDKALATLTPTAPAGE